MKKEKEFNVIICGSKNFADYKLLKEKCDYYLSERLRRGEKITIISGGEGGAEKLGEDYAKENNFSLKIISANWDKYGKRAGYLRNNKMAELGNACIAFIVESEDCKRTKMLVRLAREKHLLVREIKSSKNAGEESI